MIASSSAASSSRSTAGPNVGSNDLATITELEVAREESSSPRPYQEGTAVDDFGNQATAPKRRSTHPPVSFAANGRPITDHNQVEDPKPGPLARANTYGTSNSTGKYIKRHCFDRTKPGNIDPKPNTPRRASTIDTKYSVSFEETAIWDQKSILSLGKP